METSDSRRSFIKSLLAVLSAVLFSSLTSAASLLSGTTINGNTAWHTGNDGSGSGFNVDQVNGHDFSSGSSKPGSPSTGECFHDTDGEGIYYYNGSSWVQIA
ncbi:MAG: DUF4357 domain-containing protein [Candidatus Nanohaloarchaea archaeon]